MNNVRYEEHGGATTTSAEKSFAVEQKGSVLESAERRMERRRYVARYGFEIVGVTLRPQATQENIHPRATGEQSEQDRMVSSLVSVLGPEQKVTFVYEGGGRVPLRWYIVGEAASVESAKQATERIRNVRQALTTVLESQKASYRFRPLPKEAVDGMSAVKSKWLGLIQPHGTHVKCVNGRIGFMETGATVDETDTSVCLPHYLHERAGAFSSIIKLLVSSRVLLRVSIELEPCRLSKVQEQAIKLAQDVILDRRGDAEFPAHLENAANVWLKTLAGCRVTCSVTSSQPISEAFLKMLAGEIFHGNVDVGNRRNAGGRTDHARLPATTPHDVLDLRNCIPSSASLPLLFPQSEALARHGMRRYFNRETEALPKVGALMGCIRDGHAEQPVRLCNKERSRHLYILGATGTGKSTLLYNLAMQDIQRGEGVCVIDPHGDLFRKIRASIPEHRVDDVILLDPCDRDRAVGLNLLECTGPYRDMQINFVINELIAMIEKLYDMKICGGPMFELYFRGALQLIMADSLNPGTLVDLSAVFEHKAYREMMLKRCGSALLSDFWRMAERTSGDAALANIGPYIISKVNSFVHNAMLRPIIGQAKSTLDFRQIMDNRRILLVNLSRGALGELDTHLLGMIVMTKLMCAAMGRLNVAASRRKPFMVIVDEFQHFTTDATASLLSESRKFGLCLTLANQNLAQLSDRKGQQSIEHSVLGNVGSVALFRLGAPDAEKLAVYTRPNFGPAELQTLPNFHAAARLLTPTGPTSPFVFQTFPALRQRPDPAVLRRIQKARCLYSTDIKAVEADLSKRREEIRTLAPADGKKTSTDSTSKAS